MPNEKLLAGWAAGTPDGFCFTLKAPRRITHDAKLQRCEDLLQTLLPDVAHARAEARDAAVPAAADVQEGRGGAARLRGAAARRHPRRVRVPPRLVVRRRGLRDPARAQPRAVHRRQREDEHAGRDRPPTTRTSACATRATSRPTSSAGRRRFGAAGRQDVFVYFKHEEQGLGPEFANRLMRCLELLAAAIVGGGAGVNGVLPNHGAHGVRTRARDGYGHSSGCSSRAERGRQEDRRRSASTTERIGFAIAA